VLIFIVLIHIDRLILKIFLSSGIEGRASSGRLASMLAYSGAVVLLQLSEFEYHFSARLKPWVHYVPLTYRWVGECFACHSLAWCRGACITGIVVENETG
jgi:hypothetical protein